MTLFGFLWAAYLPSQSFLLNLHRPVTWLEDNPSMAASPSEDIWVPTSTVLAQGGVESPLPIETPLIPDTETLKVAVDWPQWTTAAAVIVVEPSSPAAGDVSKLPLPSVAHCPAAVETIVSTSITPSADRFIVQVNAVAVGQVDSAPMAEQVATQLRQAAPTIAANPTGLVPHWGEPAGSVQINGQTVLTLPPTAAPEDRMALVLTQWVNNLRLAFNAPPLSPSEVQMVAYGLGETAETIRGTASWYGPYFHGRQTAMGEIFDQEDLTAAHKTLPFGTYLEVRNLLNGKTVVVRVNDRGPYVGDRSLDLSYAAARCLGSDQVGVIPYEATILAPDHPHPWQSAQL